MKIELGTVGHFGLAVPDPHETAKWRQMLFDLEPNMGIWFHDPDGYRWELSVLANRG
jgi:hypothetical protein